MISAAVEKLRNDGVLSLVDAGTRYILELARIEYYWIQGYRAIEINEIQAEFVTHGARSAAIELFNNTESEMVADMTNEMEEDDVFWDVGANVGFHSCFAGLSKGSITLVEFEPLRPAITTLKQNTRRDGLSPTIHEVALSDTDGEMDLDPESLSNQFSSEGVTVETARGDSMVNNNEVPQPNVVKIDVEGAEPLVIDGMQEILANEDCRAVYLELHKPKVGRPSVDDFGSTVSKIEERIQDFGYQLTTIGSRPDEKHVKAKRVD